MEAVSRKKKPRALEPAHPAAHLVGDQNVDVLADHVVGRLVAEDHGHFVGARGRAVGSANQKTEKAKSTYHDMMMPFAAETVMLPTRRDMSLILPVTMAP